MVVSQFSGHILKLDPFKNMQFLHIDHLFSHSLCAIIPSLVSKAASNEVVHNNNGEANAHSAEISTLNDVSLFVFLLPLHCLFTREVILYHMTVLILCSLTWVVFVCCLMDSTCTILVKTFGTLCVSGAEDVFQIDPPPPLTLLGVTSQTPFIYLAHVEDLNFVQRVKFFSRLCL